MKKTMYVNVSTNLAYTTFEQARFSGSEDDILSLDLHIQTRGVNAQIPHLLFLVGDDTDYALFANGFEVAIWARGKAGVTIDTIELDLSLAKLLTVH